MPVNLKELTSMCSHLKILYVEDNKEARVATHKLLQNFFPQITVAVDGQDALNKFHNEAFDLILSDINMPNVNGLEMLQKIRDEDQKIPVLLISAHSDSDYFMQAIELDVDGYILKPFVYAQFIKELFKIVQRIHYLSISKNYQQNLEYEVQKRNEEISEKLHFDSLTHLLNRYTFFNDLLSLQSPTIFLVDINKFKIINEVYGSDIGSKVLKKFSSILIKTVKKSFSKIYRLSADEFAIITTQPVNSSNEVQEFINYLFEKLNNFKMDVDNNIIGYVRVKG